MARTEGSADPASADVLATVVPVNTAAGLDVAED
jgi:hypothetical protein